MSDLHLSRSELAGWRDHGHGDRGRIVAHLAACGECRHVAAELERERPLEAEARPGRFSATDFVAAGRRAGRAPRIRLGYLAAAASLVLAALVVPRWLPDSEEPAVRGSAAVVAPVHPVDATISADALTFEWTAAANAGPLRLVVMAPDDAGAPAIDREVTGTRYAPTREERSRLRAGHQYYWFVEYRGAGAGAGVSASARFRLP